MYPADIKSNAGSTTASGSPAPSDRNSLTIGPDGPILLHDVHFLEQMAHFNREKVPERQPHAKGGGAFGVFETTGDVSAHTRPALFQPGVRTELLARFSTVAGEAGSPDTWRKVPVNTYQFDGQMAYEHSGSAPVYAQNSGGRVWSDGVGPVTDGWEADGAMVRSAYTLRADDDDFAQAGALVRDVFDDRQREALAVQVAGSLLDGVHGEVLARAFQYWKSIDAGVGSRIEERVLAGRASKMGADAATA